MPQLIPFKQKGNFGFKTQNNQIVIAPVYKNVGLFVHGKAIVSKDINGKRFTGVIDTAGREILPIKYRLLYAIDNRGRGFATNGFIAADACFTIIIDDEKYTNKIGVLDRNGDVVLEPDYLNIEAHFNDSLGIVFKVVKRIESDEKTAIYNSRGKCIFPFSKGYVLSDWENQMRGLPKKTEPSKEQLLKADTTQAYTYVQGLHLHGFPLNQAIVRDKKTTLFGVYNLVTKKYILPPTYIYISVLGNAHLVCTLPDKKAKKKVYNQAYQVIDSLDSKREFTFMWGSQFSYNNSGVVYSGNYKPLNKSGNQRSRHEHFPKIGIMLIIDKNLNTACVFDTLGNVVFETPLASKYFYDEPGFDDYVKRELKQAESLDSVLNVLRIGFAPLAENTFSNKFRTSPDGQIYYGRYGGKLVAIPIKNVERFPMIKRDGVKPVFEFINGKQIPLPDELRYLFLFGTDSMYAAKHITSNEFYQVDLTGKLRLLNDGERLALIIRINAGVKPVVNNCFSCTFKEPIMLNQNWIWEYQAFNDNTLSIPMPNLVPQAGPSSAKIDLSNGQYFFFHRTTLKVFGIYKKHQGIASTPYYALFRVNRKNGDLKNYLIKKF
ncbi:MAG: WG repeat-containing protein [Bacteroidia bacterium]